MRNSILAIGLVAVLFSSCKKEHENNFEATDMTGNATLSGQIVARMVAPNGSGGYMNYNVPAAGVQVQVRVNNGGTNGLYPDAGGAVGSKVYTGVTDTMGNYRINVLANETGVTAFVTIEDWEDTRDTIVNGNTITGELAMFFGTTSRVDDISFARSLR